MAVPPTRIDHVLVAAPGFLLSRRLARLYSVTGERFELVGAQVKELAPWLAGPIDGLVGRLAESYERYRLVQDGDIDPSTSRVKLGWLLRRRWLSPLSLWVAVNLIGLYLRTFRPSNIYSSRGRRPAAAAAAARP